MTRQEMNDLYEIIKEAVKDGFLEAMAEAETREKSQYPDSERPFKVDGVTEPRLREASTPTTHGETKNAMAYLDVIHHWLDRRTFYGNYSTEEQLERMKKLLSEDEINFVLTHLRTNYVPENKKYFDENVEELLKRI
jgi:hypothetical protein